SACDLAKRPRGQLRIDGEVVTDAPRECHHPLPDRDARNHPVDEMGGSVMHPPRGARGAHAASLARKRNEVPPPAATANDACEAVREDSTAQVSVELLLDGPRQPGPVRTGGGEVIPQAVEFAGDDPVQQRRGWVATTVAAICRASEGPAHACGAV